jgi:hypothetical protein
MTPRPCRNGTRKPMARQHEGTEPVQAWVTAVSFPTEARDVLHMILSDALKVDTTDLQGLIKAVGQEDFGGWTVPRWGMRGDIAFFYHAKKALPRIKSLIRQFRETAMKAPRGDRDTLQDVVDVLLRERDLAVLLQGRVFACARLSDRAQANYSEEERSRSKHWRSPIYGSITDIHVFKHPLPYEVFGRYLTLNTGTITPLEAPAFNRLRGILSETNELPRYVADAEVASEGFRDVSASTWRRIACLSGGRFRDEAQVRSYVIDFLLRELRDPRTIVHAECRCSSDGVTNSGPPVADYFVSISGAWVPVEAKLNVGAERDIVSQVSRYLAADSFTPTRGHSKAQIRRASARCPIALVIDAAGAYTVSASGFVDGRVGEPAIPLDEFATDGVERLRQLLRARLR